jgi:hypothetical protein
MRPLNRVSKWHYADRSLQDDLRSEASFDNSRSPPRYSRVRLVIGSHVNVDELELGSLSLSDAEAV